MAAFFPAHGSPVWFGSFFSGEGPESEYTITLSYNTSDVNVLPRKDSAQVVQVFAEVAAMLKTLQLKPPVVISKISPPSASPGETVTIHGSGFTAFNSKANVIFLGVSDDLNATVAEDGKSLAFDVPTSILTVSCQEGRILIGGFCLPIPAVHVDVNDCPRKGDGSSNFLRNTNTAGHVPDSHLGRRSQCGARTVYCKSPATALSFNFAYVSGLLRFSGQCGHHSRQWLRCER